MTSPTTVPFFKTTRDPIRRLEFLRKQAEAKQSFYAEDLLAGDEVDEISTEATPDIPRIQPYPIKKYRFGKYKNNFGGDGVRARRKIKKARRVVGSKYYNKNKFDDAGDSSSVESYAPTFRPGRPGLYNKLRRVQTRPVVKYAESTTNPGILPVRTNDYKNNLRPLFNKLYSEFTKTAEAKSTEEEPSVLKRSTTSYPPVIKGKILQKFCHQN